MSNGLTSHTASTASREPEAHPQEAHPPDEPALEQIAAEVLRECRNALMTKLRFLDVALWQARLVDAWNNSAPHGAGRVMLRHDARESLSMDDYRTAMEGVYSTSVNERTIDEAPGAYKPIDDIIGPIADAVDIIDVMKPIYNFKAS